jgi:hypothetical protein
MDQQTAERIALALERIADALEIEAGTYQAPEKTWLTPEQQAAANKPRDEMAAFMQRHAALR